MHLRFHLVPSWAQLAWLADAADSSDEIDIYHGPRVEVRDGWYCEAVWDRPFEDGAFDQTDVVFGSGGRARDGQVTFVTSGDVGARIQYFRDGSHLYVSNSLACLMGYTRRQLDPGFNDYVERMGTFMAGIGSEVSLPLRGGGEVQLVYYQNIVWDTENLVRTDKPFPRRNFSSFERYREFLSSTLGSIARNMADSARRYPFRFAATLSSGYDSSAVVTLAREHGLSSVISFTNARGGVADDGRGVADALGLPVRLVPRDAWRNRGRVAEEFLGADGTGGDVFMSAVGDELGGVVLLSGYHGDRVWEKELDAKYLSPNLVRGDRSSVGMSEYRLRKGFIVAPVPFLGGRQVRDIHAISNSREMAPWDVGGNYNRPVCRRIIEEAGVPRGAFARGKSAAAVLFHKTETHRAVAAESMGSESDAAYAAWLERQGQRVGRAGEFSPAEALNLRARAEMAFKAASVLDRLGGPFRKVGNRLRGWATRTTERVRFYDYVVPWAVETLADRYRRPLEQSEEKRLN